MALVSNYDDFEIIPTPLQQHDAVAEESTEPTTMPSCDGATLPGHPGISLWVNTDTRTSHAMDAGTGRRRTVWHDSLDGVDLLATHRTFLRI